MGEGLFAKKIGGSEALFYRFKIGALEAAIVSDGTIPVFGAIDEAFEGSTPTEVMDLLRENFLPTDHLTLEQNSLVVQSGDRLILFDTGSGASLWLGPDSGRLTHNLAVAGYPPEEFTDVVLTHAHWDHCWGLIDSDGAPAFPNARVYLARNEFEYWTDEAKLERDDWIKKAVEVARASLIPYHNKLIFVEDGAEIIPGITCMATPGHTVGHHVYFIESDGDRLCFIGDMVHHHILLIERPTIEFCYDTDRKLSVESRLRLLNKLADERTRLVGYHFPWPGIGYVARNDNSFRYHPSPIETVYWP